MGGLVNLDTHTDQNFGGGMTERSEPRMLIISAAQFVEMREQRGAFFQCFKLPECHGSFGQII